MSSHARKPIHEKAEPKAQDNSLALILTLADTTWRMLVPTGVLACLAVWADISWGTKPWLTIMSVPAGLMVSAGLIRKQMRSVQ